MSPRREDPAMLDGAAVLELRTTERRLAERQIQAMPPEVLLERHRRRMEAALMGRRVLASVPMPHDAPLPGQAEPWEPLHPDCVRPPGRHRRWLRATAFVLIGLAGAHLIASAAGAWRLAAHGEPAAKTPTQGAQPTGKPLRRGGLDRA